MTRLGGAGHQSPMAKGQPPRGEGRSFSFPEQRGEPCRVIIPQPAFCRVLPPTRADDARVSPISHPDPCLVYLAPDPPSPFAGNIQPFGLGTLLFVFQLSIPAQFPPPPSLGGFPPLSLHYRPFLPRVPLLLRLLPTAGALSSVNLPPHICPGSDVPIAGNS